MFIDLVFQAASLFLLFMINGTWQTAASLCWHNYADRGNSTRSIFSFFIWTLSYNDVLGSWRRPTLRAQTAALKATLGLESPELLRFRCHRAAQLRHANTWIRNRWSSLEGRNRHNAGEDASNPELNTIKWDPVMSTWCGADFCEIARDGR